MQPERKIEPLPAPDRLDSWKEIAGYLNRSERTVRRWETYEELPVHRLHHDKRGSVYAYTRELDAWRVSRKLPEDEPEDKPPTPIVGTRVLVAGVLVLALSITAAAFVWWPRSTPPARAGTSNEQARLAYERALFAGNAGRVQIETGIRYYQQAVQLDPKFAQAWAGLASAHMAITWFAERPVAETMADARREAEHARQLDPKLSSAWRVLGFVSHYLDWDHQVAEAHFRHALALNPRDAAAQSWYGDFLLDLRRFDEARAAYTRAESASPRWLEPPIFRANIYTFTGQPALAIVEQRRTLESEPNYGLGNHFLGRAYAASGDWARAIEYLRKSNQIIGDVPFTLGNLGYALAASGNRAEAERLLHELRSRRDRGYYPAFPIAEIELGLGNTQAGLDWLEAAVAERHTGFYLPSVDPIYDSVRNTPRFRDMMQRMNLPSR